MILHNFLTNMLILITHRSLALSFKKFDYLAMASKQGLKLKLKLNKAIVLQIKYFYCSQTLKKI